MNPFSWLAFSNFFLIIGPSFRKKGCCHGRAVVPGPLVLEYSREIASAFLYTANETNKRQIQINAKKLKCNYMLSLFKSNSFDFHFHSFVRWVVHSFIQSINPAVSQWVSQSVRPSVSSSIRPSVGRSVSLSQSFYQPLNHFMGLFKALELIL